MTGLKEASIAFVDRLFADAGIADGMSWDEITRRVAAEFTRRERKAMRRDTAAAFLRALRRLWERS